MWSPEENKTLVQRYLQRLDEDAVAAIDEFVAEDFVDHMPGRGLGPNRDGLKESARRFLAAVPDGFHRVEQILADGDRVVTLVRGYGTHTGELLGVAPTSRLITTVGIVIFRLRDGRIVERWSAVDNYGLLRELAPSSMKER
jgi:predicted ester cyclase